MQKMLESANLNFIRLPATCLVNLAGLAIDQTQKSETAADLNN